jgi:hypothetical protein
MSAIISPCGQYLYLLKRHAESMSPMKTTPLFVMLNPTTADPTLDDLTIRRCRGFAKLWDGNGLTVANCTRYARLLQPRYGRILTQSAQTMTTICGT